MTDDELLAMEAQQAAAADDPADVADPQDPTKEGDGND